MPEDPRKPTTWATRITIGLLSLLLLPAAYYGAYRIAIDDRKAPLFPDPLWEQGKYVLANYRKTGIGWLDSHRLRDFFEPARKFDKIVRPERWTPGK